MQRDKRPFWKRKTLVEMTSQEWESLCDGCGKCCLVLIEEPDGATWETDVACALFDPKRRCCTDYENRTRRVPDCVRLTPRNVSALRWMPESCAYRRIAEGRGLADWHPLVSGDPDSVRRAGIAVSPDLASEADVDDDELEDRITDRRCPSR